MGSWSGGNSSRSPNRSLRTPGSEEDQQVEKKSRRMQSNRESARRSRLRKQKHLDDLTHQMSRLRNHNNRIVAELNVATNLFIGVEAENSILRTQMMELIHRLKCLNDIEILLNSMKLFEISSEVGNLNYEFDFEDEDYSNYWGSPLAN